MTTTAPEGPSYKGLRPDLPMDGRVVEEGRRSCATPQWLFTPISTP